MLQERKWIALSVGLAAGTVLSLLAIFVGKTISGKHGISLNNLLNLNRFSNQQKVSFSNEDDDAHFFEHFIA